MVQAPMKITEETKRNLGKVHYQLAILHGMGRFPLLLPSTIEGKVHSTESTPDHDSFSVLFHLSYAAALHHASACLALARVQANLDSHVSSLLSSIVPTNFDSAKQLLRRTMDAPASANKPKVAAGCLLFQILHDESLVAQTSTDNDSFDNFDTASIPPSNGEMAQVLEDTLELFDAMEKEESEVAEHRNRQTQSFSVGLQCGDRVMADYAMEGALYLATIQSVSDDDQRVTVCYDDDSTVETLPVDHVRAAVPPTANQTSSNGPLSDDDAFGGIDDNDDGFVGIRYELLHDLAQLKEKIGDPKTAMTLYEQAADGAMTDGKMKLATQWSLKAAALAN